MSCSPILEFGLACSSARLVQSQPLWVLECNGPVMSHKHCFAGSYNAAGPASTMSPQPRVEACDIGVSFRAEHTTVSLLVDQLWVSVVIAIYCKKKVLWWSLRDILSCKFHFSLQPNIPLAVCTHLHFLCISWWTSRLFLLPGYCDKSITEHVWAGMSVVGHGVLWGKCPGVE